MLTQGPVEMPKWVPAVAIGGAVATFLIVLMGYGISVSNTEVRLRRAIEAKLTDNGSEFDNLFKKINQVCQVTEQQKTAISELVTGYAEARGGSKPGFVTMLQEAVPNQSFTAYEKLANVITASRDSWTMRQKELIDLKREHDTLRSTFPSSMIVGGRPEIAIVVVTSSHAKEVMKTGSDDELDLFTTNPPAQVR